MSDSLKNSTFPLSASGSVRLVLTGQDQVFPTDKDLTWYEPSAPVRIGPLAFRIQAKSEPSRLTYSLICKSIASKFPWAGKVSGKFQILETHDKFKLIEPFKTTEQGLTQDSRTTTLGSAEHDWREIWKSCWRGKNLSIEAVVDVKVALKPTLGGEGEWQIPLSLLTLKTGHPGNISEIFESQDWSDIEIESRDGDRIRAHRVIIAGSSQVFKNMSRTDKLENVVKMDIGSKALKIMLKFIYTGAFRKEIEDFKGLDTEVFLDLLGAGEKYELPLLMKFAGVALMLRCTRENGWKLFFAARKYGKVMEETWGQIGEFVKKTVDITLKEEMKRERSY